MNQKRKSGVVLLITLFFITSISILILHNLEDNEKFIEESKFETDMMQLKITSQNIENEVMSLVKKYSDNIDNIVEITSMGIPFDYGNIKLNLTLDYYTVAQCNINDINFSVLLNEQCDENIIDNISYEYDFLELLKGYKKKYSKFTTQEQIDYFINDYKQQTRDEKIDTIKNDFAFLKLDENKTILQCNYEILINSNTTKGMFIFDTNQSKKLFYLTIK